MKRINLFVFSVISMLIINVNVNAKEVSTSSDLLDCLTSGGTCTLTSSVELEDRFVVATGKTVILDLNGKTLDLTYETINYSALIQGDLTIKGNGTFNITNCYGIGVTGKLTIENGDFNQEKGDYLIGNWGTTTIKDGTFNGDYNILNVFSGSGLVENGVFNTKPYGEEGQPKYYWAMLVEEGANLEVKKGTFNQILSWPNVLADDAEVTYKLDAENILYDSVKINGNVTIDLNGNTVSFAEDEIETGEDSMFIVLRGAKLTINDSKGTGKISTGNNEKLYAAVKLTNKGEAATGNLAQLIVDGGTLEGYYYGITGNGTRHDTKITINDGIIKSLNGTAIYNPQFGELNIHGGTITGKTGVEMRAGTLNVTEGTIIGTYKPLESEENGNGTTTDGAGIAIVQHTTKKNINVNISGGIIQGYYALYEADLQENNLPETITLNITGGEFETINDGTVIIYSEDHTGFISGGTYSIEPLAKYVTSPYVAKKNGEVYVIGVDSNDVTSSVEEVDPEEEVEEVLVGVTADDKDTVEEVLLESLDANKELITNNSDDIEIKVEISNTEINENNKELIEEVLEENKKNIIVASFFEVDVNVYTSGDKVGQISELTDKIKLTVMLPEKLQDVKDGYTRKFYIARVHNGKTDLIETELSEDGKYVTFETDKFSTYAIAYEDVEVTLPPKTGDNVTIYFLIGFVSIITLVGFCFYFKKIFN